MRTDTSRITVRCLRDALGELPPEAEVFITSDPMGTLFARMDEIWESDDRGAVVICPGKEWFDVSPCT